MNLALSMSGVTAVMGLVLGCGGYLVLANQMTVDSVTEFLFQSFRLQSSLAEISKLSGEVNRASSAIDRINQIFAVQPTIELKKGEELPRVRGAISFYDISFAYPSRPDIAVLKNISLDIPAGQVYAIVGPSGSGKSTILSLIERFYNLTAGKITLDGRDIASLNPTWLHQQIGIVGQEPVLFDTSVLENIRYGRPDATNAEVFEAAKKANCHTFISAFPDQYQTQVGERGVQLSGGQKQRIAIARALLLNPPILILDEATSSLDAESEVLVQEALEKVMHDRTVIVVAHRLSTIRNADKIVVLKHGKVVETGTHQELLDLNQVYAQQFATQFKDQ